MAHRSPRLATFVGLVTASGACALVYQIIWTRHFRLVFGASTAASAAVLAIFMGGLGLGGHFLGRRVDRVDRPLLFYGNLEVGVAVLAGVSPWLVDLVRLVYVATGGEAALGRAGATVLRLLLSVLVLGPPTVLMGGTLPAVVRAAEEAGDHARRRLGVLYGANTFGAVAGAFFATFFMVEVFGLRSSLWIAALGNALVGISARSLGRKAPPVVSSRQEGGAAAAAPGAGSKAAGPAPALVYGAAAVTGFVFFAMEIVWYRMLAPLLGGSVYGFGLVLVLALSGIGAGARIYGLGARMRRPTVLLFGATCALEALALGLPLWVGDGMVAVAWSLRGWNLLGFGGLVAGWTLVAGFLVLPPSLVAGYQFPVLVGLLGRGGEQVGRQVGTAYLANTAGAIAGALVAGFGLLRALGAVGMWRALVVSLSLLSLAFVLAGRLRLRRAVATAAAAAVAALPALATGPTAAWRHSPVGAGRLSFPTKDPMAFEGFLRTARGDVAWETDGVETSFAVTRGNGLSFLVTGKSDGNAKIDAPTVVMLSLIGAAVHPGRPRRGLVIGLGTGSSAGWLADVPGIEHVDVVELEPSIERFARQCAAVNRHLFDKPHVALHFGDGREFLAVAGGEYDVVVSEPSNPYRSGIASLFSRDFYHAARDRMAADGVFVQWFQAYEVDGRTVQSALATLASVFPAVEVWATREGDLALVAYMAPPRHDLSALEARLAAPVFREGMAAVWGVAGVEGLFAGYLAGPGLAALAAEARPELVDTDDRPIIEFGFSRTLGASYRVRRPEVAAAARAVGQDVPPGFDDPEWRARLEDARSAWAVFQDTTYVPERSMPAWVQAHHEARAAASAGRYDEALAAWERSERPLVHPHDLRLRALAAVGAGHPAADESIAAVEAVYPTDARILRALAAAGRGAVRQAVLHLTRGFAAARGDPWFSLRVMGEGLDLAQRVGVSDPDAAARLLDALSEPFAVEIYTARRHRLRVVLAAKADWENRCVEVLAPYEPHAPWLESFLGMRVDCYERTGRDELLDAARADLDRFLAMRPVRLSDLVSGAGS